MVVASIASYDPASGCAQSWQRSQDERTWPSTGELVLAMFPRDALASGFRVASGAHKRVEARKQQFRSALRPDPNHSRNRWRGNLCLRRKCSGLLDSSPIRPLMVTGAKSLSLDHLPIEISNQNEDGNTRKCF